MVSQFDWIGVHSGGMYRKWEYSSAAGPSAFVRFIPLPPTAVMRSYL